MDKGAASTTKKRMQFRFMGIALEKLNLIERYRSLSVIARSSPSALLL